MTRLALSEGQTFDFSELIGNLPEDLSKRDFTINSMAFSPGDGLVDLHGGARDVLRGSIRAISEENILADPLRMLRAYRFAAQLNGTIESRTREIVKKRSSKITQSSPERITFEIFNLLNSTHASKYLKMALDDGLLTRLLSINSAHLYRNVRAIYKLEKALSAAIPHRLKVLLNEPFSQNITRNGLLCLLILLYRRSTPSKKTIRLRLSRRIVTRLTLAHRCLDSLPTRRNVSISELFDIFLRADDAALDVLLIKNRPPLLKEYERFKRIWNRGLLTSEEIILLSNPESGPEIRRAIENVRKAQFQGAIRTRTQAIHYLTSLRLTDSTRREKLSRAKS